MGSAPAGPAAAVSAVDAAGPAAGRCASGSPDVNGAGPALAKPSEPPPGSPADVPEPGGSAGSSVTATAAVDVPHSAQNFAVLA